MSLLDLFRKKEHREKYEEALKEVEKKHTAFGRKVGFYLSPPNYPRGMPRDYRIAEHNYHDAKERLKELYAEGQKEATQLNQKYDALFADVKEIGKKFDGATRQRNNVKEEIYWHEYTDARDKLYDFEKKELGMHGENERWLGKHKKNIGTIVGIFAITSLIISSLNAVAMTGNVIGNASNNPSNSSIFLLIGIALGVAWFFLREK